MISLINETFKRAGHRRSLVVLIYSVLLTALVLVLPSLYAQTESSRRCLVLIEPQTVPEASSGLRASNSVLTFLESEFPGLAHLSRNLRPPSSLFSADDDSLSKRLRARKGDRSATLVNLRQTVAPLWQSNRLRSMLVRLSVARLRAGSAFLKQSLLTQSQANKPLVLEGLVVGAGANGNAFVEGLSENNGRAGDWLQVDAADAPASSFARLGDTGRLNSSSGESRSDLIAESRGRRENLNPIGGPEAVVSIPEAYPARFAPFEAIAEADAVQRAWVSTKTPLLLSSRVVRVRSRGIERLKSGSQSELDSWPAELEIQIEFSPNEIITVFAHRLVWAAGFGAFDALNKASIETQRLVETEVKNPRGQISQGLQLLQQLRAAHNLGQPFRPETKGFKDQTVAVIGPKDTGKIVLETLTGSANSRAGIPVDHLPKKLIWVGQTCLDCESYNRQSRGRYLGLGAFLPRRENPGDSDSSLIPGLIDPIPGRLIEITKRVTKNEKGESIVQLALKFEDRNNLVLVDHVVLATGFTTSVYNSVFQDLITVDSSGGLVTSDNPLFQDGNFSYIRGAIQSLDPATGLARRRNVRLGATFPKVVFSPLGPMLERSNNQQEAGLPFTKGLTAGAKKALSVQLPILILGPTAPVVIEEEDIGPVDANRVSYFANLPRGRELGSQTAKLSISESDLAPNSWGLLKPINLADEQVRALLAQKEAIFTTVSPKPMVADYLPGEENLALVDLKARLLEIFRFENADQQDQFSLGLMRLRDSISGEEQIVITGAPQAPPMLVWLLAKVIEEDENFQSLIQFLLPSTTSQILSINIGFSGAEISLAQVFEYLANNNLDLEKLLGVEVVGAQTAASISNSDSQDGNQVRSIESDLTTLNLSSEPKDIPNKISADSISLPPFTFNQTTTAETSQTTPPQVESGSSQAQALLSSFNSFDIPSVFTTAALLSPVVKGSLPPGVVSRPPVLFDRLFNPFKKGNTGQIAQLGRARPVPWLKPNDFLGSFGLVVPDRDGLLGFRSPIRASPNDDRSTVILTPSITGDSDGSSTRRSLSVKVEQLINQLKDSSESNSYRIWPSGSSGDLIIFGENDLIIDAVFASYVDESGVLRGGRFFYYKLTKKIQEIQFSTDASLPIELGEMGLPKSAASLPELISIQNLTDLSLLPARANEKFPAPLGLLVASRAEIAFLPSYQASDQIESFVLGVGANQSTYLRAAADYRGFEDSEILSESGLVIPRGLSIAIGSVANKGIEFIRKSFLATEKSVKVMTAKKRSDLAKLTGPLSSGQFIEPMVAGFSNQSPDSFYLAYSEKKKLFFLFETESLFEPGIPINYTTFELPDELSTFRPQSVTRVSMSVEAGWSSYRENLRELFEKGEVELKVEVLGLVANQNIQSTLPTLQELTFN